MAEFFSLVAAVSLAEGTGCRGEQEKSLLPLVSIFHLEF